VSRKRDIGVFRHSGRHPVWAALPLACASPQVNTFVTLAPSLGDRKRPVGQTLSKYLNPRQTLHLSIDERDQYEPFLYYLPCCLVYLRSDQGLDPQMRYLLAIDSLYVQTVQRLARSGLQLQTLCQLEYKRDDYLLGEVVPAAQP
jgi:hypothetical protein